MSAYKQTQAYNKDKWWFGLVQNAFSTVLGAILLLAGYLPWLWLVSGRLIAKAGVGKPSEIVQTVAFLLCEMTIQTLLGLPWGYYSTFVVEQRHGFNKQTVGLWIKDTIKSLVLTFLLAPVVVVPFTYILQHTGPYVALYLWLFITFISLLFMTVYPVLIAPLFNKYTPLPENSLRGKIEALAGSLKFPLKKLFVVDGSTRSAHSNAYMYGFFKNKRIVLYDTLIEQCSESQVVAVLAHELGHWKLAHTPYLFVISNLVLLFQLSLFTVTRNNPDVYNSFGFTNAKPVFVALMLFQYIMSPLDEVITYLSNVVSRRFEFQADGFAVSLGHCSDLKDALLKLDEKNKSASNVDPWYSAYHYSHPPLVERLEAIDAATKEDGATKKEQ